MTEDQAAMAAARLEIARAKESQARALRKEQWIAEARKSFRPGKPCPCVVCERYVSVTHAHHVIPLHMQFECGAPTPNHAVVWLCPTHHAGVHLFLKRGKNWKYPNTSGFPKCEHEAMIEIALPAFNWEMKQYEAA